MLLADVALSKTVILVDTNVIIEAVRTNCWNALTGRAIIETVEECRVEAQRGDSTMPGYVVVSPEHLSRVARVHSVSALSRATFALKYPAAESMDGGERQLFAHAYEREQSGDMAWVLSSPDKASIRAAVTLHWGDQLRSLGGIMTLIGGRPKPPLGAHHLEPWLSQYRTEYLLNP